MSKNRLSIAAPEPEHTDRRGKIVHDARGRAVWDWAIETGVLAKRTANELLGTLQQGASSLECEPDPAQSWSGDPYNRPAR